MMRRVNPSLRPALLAPGVHPPGDVAGVVPRRRQGHLGALSVTQLLVTEAALVATLVAATRGVVAGVVAGTVAVAVVAATLGRSGGRWWLEGRLVAWQHRRRRTRAVGNGDGAALAALRTLAPGLTVQNVSAPDGARVGVARDDAGWYAVAAMTPTVPVPAGGAPIPLDNLVAALAEADQPGVVLQLLTHTVPAPSLDAHPASPVGASYRQLLGTGRVPVPAHRETWVAVRLDARSLAEAVIDHTADLAGAGEVTAALGRRVATCLRRLGVACRMIDADELVAALSRSCGLEFDGPGDTAQVREEWTTWRSADLSHRCFWLRSWPPVEQIGALLDTLAAAPAALTSVSLSLAAEPGDRTDLRGLVRVAAPAKDLPRVCQLLIDGAARAGAELFPLDGEHGPGVYATAPTGGGAG